MAEQTANYGLFKPEPDEFYDVNVPNGNMDIIDNKLKYLEASNAAIASSSKLGHVKVGQGLTISADGTLNAEAQAVPNASTTVAGITKLNDSLTSTSTSEAATANAVKKVNEVKVNKAGDTMTGDFVIEKNIPNIYLRTPNKLHETIFRLNASSENDFGLDIYRNGVIALRLDRSGKTFVQDGAGVLFNLADLKSSVSNGKAAIANAITQKGAPTTPTAEFATMAANILAIPGLKQAGGVSNGSNSLDIPAGTFGFTPKIIITKHAVGNDSYTSFYVATNAMYEGSSAGSATTFLFDGSHNNAGPATTTIRNGGFLITTRAVWTVTVAPIQWTALG